jgi:hypothetical protein
MRPWNSTPAGYLGPWARHGLLDTQQVISVTNVKRGLGGGLLFWGECVICAVMSEIQLNQNIPCRFQEHFNFSDTNCLEEYFDPKGKSSRKMEYALRKNIIFRFQQILSGEINGTCERPIRNVGKRSRGRLQVEGGPSVKRY